jgi:hypothetical protein
MLVVRGVPGRAGHPRETEGSEAVGSWELLSLSGRTIRRHPVQNFQRMTHCWRQCSTQDSFVLTILYKKECVLLI